MKKLHKRNNTAYINIEPNKGERTLSCSNKGSMRSSLLGFLDTSSENASNEMISEYFAKLIVDMFIETNYANTTKKGSNILPGIDKRTG